MTAKPRASQTAHLRRAIRKAAHEHANRPATKRQVKRSRSRHESWALQRLQNSKTAYWHRIERQPGEDCKNIDPENVMPGSPDVVPTDVKQDSDGDSRALNNKLSDSPSTKREDALRDVLKHIADDMTKIDRPYAAAAALAARVMVTQGRTEDINVGLWPLVSRHRASRRESGPGHEQGKVE